MKKYLITIILFTLFYTFSLAKEKNYKPIDLKQGYEYIPLEYLSDSTTYGLLISSRMVFDTLKNEIHHDISFVNEFSFCWDSYCTDGRYILKVTPEQIYLYSSHENPNPNLLEWVISVDKIVFKTLKQNYKKIKSLDCDDNFCFDKKYNDEKFITEKNYSEDCENLLLKQTKRIINKINKLIKDKKYKIDFDKRVFAGVLFYSYEHEYDVQVIPINK